MALSSLENEAKYFGFNDLHGYKDFVVYVYSCAPELFPTEDWRSPDEQMDLDKAFIGLRYGLRLAAEEKGESPLLDRCRRLVEAAYVEYRGGRDEAGQHKLEEVEELLKRLPSQ